MVSGLGWWVRDCFGIGLGGGVVLGLDYILRGWGCWWGLGLGGGVMGMGVGKEGGEGWEWGGVGFGLWGGVGGFFMKGV